MAPNAIPLSLGDDEARNTRNQHGFQVLVGTQRRTVGNFFTHACFTNREIIGRHEGLIKGLVKM